MVREFELPDVGEGVAEGELVRWLVDPGDAVSEDQPIAEVETDKAMVDLPSPVDGHIRELHAEEGEMVPVGSVVVTFDVEGEDSAAEPTADADAETDDSAAVADTEAETDTSDAEVAISEGRVFASPSVRRRARAAGIDLDSIEGSGPGGRITAADVQAAASGGDTGAVSADEEPAADDADLTEASRTADRDTAEASSPTSRETAGTTAASSARIETGSADRDRTLAAPATRRVAREEDVDLDAVPAVEERDGEAFVTAEAVREYAESQRAAQEADAQAVRADSTGDTREPYRGVRRTIGEAMANAKFTAPHVTHHDIADVTALVETRERLASEADERGIKLTYTPFVMKAVAAALQEHPILNAQLDEENEEIVKRGEYNLGVATDTDAGLMVPVVDDADRKGLLELASETNELAQKARERSIEPPEMRGGTFTITNVGVIGGEYATPIINHPEVAILALGAIKPRPRVHEGEVVPRETLPLSLTIDHRVVDGADAARFTNRVIELLEEPSLLLLE